MSKADPFRPLSAGYSPIIAWQDPALAPDDDQCLAVVLRLTCGEYAGGRFISTASRMRGQWVIPPQVEELGHVEVTAFLRLPELPPLLDRGQQ